MDETLWHKFTQHHELREELLATGDAELVEVFSILLVTYTMYIYRLNRIRIRTHFGVSALMDSVATSWGKLLKG
jgi:hypothetical protein